MAESLSASVKSRRTISIIVENEFGSLARIVELFSGRVYNIESLSVAVVDKARNLSRVMVTTVTDIAVTNLIIKLLTRLVPVYVAEDLTAISHIEATLALIKIRAKKDMTEISLLTKKMNVITVDSALDSYIFEITGTNNKVDEFIDKLSLLAEIIEISRTGVASLACGIHSWKDSALNS